MCQAFFLHREARETVQDNLQKGNRVVGDRKTETSHLEWEKVGSAGERWKNQNCGCLEHANPSLATFQTDAYSGVAKLATHSGRTRCSFGITALADAVRRRRRASKTETDASEQVPERDGSVPGGFAQKKDMLFRRPRKERDNPCSGTRDDSPFVCFTLDTKR